MLNDIYSVILLLVQSVLGTRWKVALHILLFRVDSDLYRTLSSVL